MVLPVRKPLQACPHLSAALSCCFPASCIHRSRSSKLELFILQLILSFHPRWKPYSWDCITELVLLSSQLSMMADAQNRDFPWRRRGGTIIHHPHGCMEHCCLAQSACVWPAVRSPNSRTMFYLKAVSMCSNISEKKQRF